TAAAPGAGTPTGTVTFVDGSTALGSATLANGSATFTTAALTVGAHAITASFTGGANFNTSGSTRLGPTVNPAHTTTTVTSAPNPSAFGQAVAFTIGVAAVAPGTGTPTGSVTVTIDGSGQGAFPLSNGQAFFSLSTLAGGTHTISATYSGDGNFNA